VELARTDLVKMTEEARNRVRMKMRSRMVLEATLMMVLAMMMVTKATKWPISLLKLMMAS